MAREKPSILPLPDRSQPGAFEQGSCRPSEGRGTGSWGAFAGPWGGAPLLCAGGRLGALPTGSCFPHRLAVRFACRRRQGVGAGGI